MTPALAVASVLANQEEEEEDSQTVRQQSHTAILKILHLAYLFHVLLFWDKVL